MTLAVSPALAISSAPAPLTATVPSFTITTVPWYSVISTENSVPTTFIEAAADSTSNHASAPVCGWIL